MKKETKRKVKKVSALFEIAMMISLTIAFSFIMSENVGAAREDVDGLSPSQQAAEAATIPAATPPTTTGGAWDIDWTKPKPPETITPGTSPLVPNQPSSIPTPTAVSPDTASLRSTGFDSAGAKVVKTADGLNGKMSADGNSLFVKDANGNTYTFKNNPATGKSDLVNINGNEFSNGLKTTEYKPVETIFGNKLQSPIYGNLYQGLTWSLMAASAIQLIGGLVGFDQELTNSLTYSTVGGIMAGKLALGAMQSAGGAGQYGGGFLNTIASKTGLTQGQTAFGVGAIVAIAIFVATYKKTDTKRVQFQCLPWEAPSGGAKCEECNGDPLRPCTEYRCRSLGQACELLNANTANPQCAWVSRNDVESPKIIPWNAALYPSNLKYEPDNQVRPPAIGSKILTTSNACLPAFTPLEFGFTTNEPAQCKVDIVHTNTFDSMENYVEDNYFSYNHTQKMRLPGPRNDTTSSIQLRNDGTMQLYIRCKDANGNQNVDEYVFSFCVDKGPDTTPPIMEEFSLPDGSYVTHNTDNVPIELYVNEPAQCKWSPSDKNYDDMENAMRCFNSPDQVNADLQYTCMANVTGVKNTQENNYYFRCKDDADNKNTASKKLLLRGSQPLNILKVLPNETVTGSTEYVSVGLQVETGDGAEEGKALCYFSETGLKDSYIQMFETDNFMHSQQLSLRNGNYKYYFRCIDYGGNAAENSTEFSVFVDKSAPMITRAYKEDALKIVTDEDAQCTYSLSTCDFELEDGQEMIYSNPDNMDRLFAEWKAGQSYYIKCQDLYGNQPSPNQCSMIVSTVEIAHDVDDDD